MAEITITIQGDRELLDRLKKISASLNDMATPFDKAGGLLTKFYATVPFASRGTVYGTSWPALTDAYLKQKVKKWGGGRPILIASGDMAKAFQYESTKNMLRIFNPTPYFPAHQLGSGNIPQRVVMLLDKQRKQTVIDEVANEVNRVIANG